MNKYYEDRLILKQITSRLIPSESIYPDCICELIMTEDFLYVLEDNFDGTYNCLFKIPFYRLISVEGTNGSGDKGGFRVVKIIVYAIVITLAGLISIPGGSNLNAAQDFLTITYKNEDNQLRYIFFQNCSNMRGMVKTFKKYK